MGSSVFAVVDSYLRLYRSASQPLAVGEVFEKDGLRAKVLTVSPIGPTEVEFTIEGLTTGHACLAQADQWYLKPTPLPAIGESATIPWNPPTL